MGSRKTGIIKQDLILYKTALPANLPVNNFPVLIPFI